MAYFSKQNNGPQLWIISDGKTGTENQCLGLAAAMGLVPRVIRVAMPFPWRHISPYMPLPVGWLYDNAPDFLQGQLPDYVIAGGRRAVAAALAVRRASRHNKHPTKIIFVQNPYVPLGLFDAVIAPEHDGLRGPNVISTCGAMHKMTKQMLLDEADKFRADFITHHYPRVAVMVGGNSAAYSMTEKHAHALCDALLALRDTSGASLMITVSRRTGAENGRILRDRLQGPSLYFWDGTGPNPYAAMLGLADYTIVTADSVSMISEASMTGRPVYVFPLAGGSKKFRAFHAAMQQRGITRPFNGVLESWAYEPLNEAARVAALLKPPTIKTLAMN